MSGCKGQQLGQRWPKRGSVQLLTVWESLSQTPGLQDVTAGAILSELTLVNVQAHVCKTKSCDMSGDHVTCHLIYAVV